MAENPLTVALKTVFGPLVKQSTQWPNVLAYGLPGIVAVLMIVLLRPVVPTNVIWLLAVVIVSPLIAFIVLDYKARQSPPVGPAPSVSPPAATIDYPQKNQPVDRTIYCSGFASGIQPDKHLWLVVEAVDCLWPKEGDVYVTKDSRWNHTIFEDGVTKRFAVALLVANKEADKWIRAWLENGKSTGVYEKTKGIPGTTRLARVDGLHLLDIP